MTPPLVGLVLVAHSAKLAEGAAELAHQMAPDVAVVAAGGLDDGGLGTSFERISAALAAADSPAGVVVLYDLGSALLTTETAIEFLDPEVAARVEIVDAPLAEGALAAAVVAQGGADRDAVAAAAQSAGRIAPSASSPDSADDSDRLSRTLRLRNPLGLHARPAGALVRTLDGIQATVALGRPGQPAVDARSLLAVVALATRGGDELQFEAAGADAETALDRIEQLVEAGFGELDVAPRAEPIVGPRSAEPQPGVAGEAVGELRRVGAIRVPDRRGAGTEAERARLSAALDATRAVLGDGDDMARAHAALLTDPGLLESARAALDLGATAESAWWRAVEESAGQLSLVPDELVAARAVDVRDAGAAVLRQLGVEADRLPPAGVLPGAIVLADELGPTEVTRLVEGGVAGVVLDGGSPTAHAVVVARGLGLPVVLQAGGLLANVPDGTLVAIDGTAATIDVDPGDAAARRNRIAAERARRDRQRAEASAPVTVGGRPILIAANVGSLAEARFAVESGADGIGLLRTELLMLDRPALPDEQTQTDDLVAILELAGDRPVVVRVLDAGGDKPVRALRLDPRRNGFLGVRGVRWLFENPDVLHTQLRAICRGAVGHRVSVMAPMVTTAGDARRFADAVAAAVESLRADGSAHQPPDAVGVMIEVPAAALTVDEIAPAVDFVSVGTNDLVSYLMAADRTEPGVADLLDPSSAAVWRTLERLCADAQRAGIAVAVCGEMGGDERFARRLIGLGVTELSMAAARIPEIKQLLRG